MSTKKLSYRRNRKAKLTYFKKGNRCNEIYLPKMEQPNTAETGITGNCGNTQSKITRPNIVEFSDACRLAATNQSLHPLELPSKLRPVKTAKKQQ